MTPQQAYSVNRAVDYAKLKRDTHKKTGRTKSEKYYVVARDEKGKEYTIKYFF